MLRIAEVFDSIQGEGRFTGVPTSFVRTTGCNLRCSFCDTPYTSWQPEGIQRTWESVLDEILSYPSEHVVVTGGEPMLQPDVVPLTYALRDAGKQLTIETAGTVFRRVHADLMSISPKLSNSTPADSVWRPRHERLRDNRAVVTRLIAEYPYQLKFVIDRVDDIAEVEAYLTGFDGVAAEHVWLMPQARCREELEEKTAWLREEASRCGYQFSPRLHIELFGNVRGK